MNLKNDILECCTYLESTKINERKKYCNKLANYLENNEVIVILNLGDYVSWKKVLLSVQECLRKVCYQNETDTFSL